MKNVLALVVCGLGFGVLATGCRGRTDATVDPGGVSFPGGPGNALDLGEPTAQPFFGSTVTAPTPPPPITGGTLTVLHDGTTAVAADPDRDRIYVIDTNSNQKVADLALTAGDQPGRVIEDGAGRVHVALRGGGAFVTIDPSTWTITSRRAVCAAPRGLVWDSTNDVVHVACAGGELVTFPSASGSATRTLHLDRDLRDPVMLDGELYVSRFRTAELVPISSAGAVGTSIMPAQLQTADPSSGQPTTFSPNGAWRTITVANQSSIFMLHQRGSDSVINVTQPGGYGGGDPCSGSISQSTISIITPGSAPTSMPALGALVLAVDVAYQPSTDTFAVVAPGNTKMPGGQTVGLFPGSSLGNFDTCTFPNTPSLPSTIEPVAVAFTSGGAVLVQSREPAMLWRADTATAIPLSTASVADTGHEIFHANAGAGIACASCHLEGGEDSRVWNFDTVGPRRTQSIRGGIIGTEPFHWDGSEKAFSNIMSDVFVHRMNGPTLAIDQQMALETWVDKIPLIAQSPPTDAAAVSRGQALFTDSSIGCSSCHSGAKFTDNATVDVGTGGAFQVPALHGVAWRAPFFHDGHVATLADRFTAAGGGDTHGVTSQLTPSQIDDLIAYLNTI